MVPAILSMQRTAGAIAVVLMAFPLLVAARTLEEFSPRLSASAQVVWNAPTNNLLRSLWVYQRHGPRIFSPAIISNAMVLGSLQGKGIPKPPTKDFFIWEDRGPNYPGPIPARFSIRPAFGTMFPRCKMTLPPAAPSMLILLIATKYIFLFITAMTVIIRKFLLSSPAPQIVFMNTAKILKR